MGWKVPLDFDAVETSQLNLIERARLFVKLRFGQFILDEKSGEESGKKARKGGKKGKEEP